MVKGSIQEEDITVINIYAHNTGVPRYLQQILTDIKGEIYGNTIIVGDFNTPLTSMDRSSRQKINKAKKKKKRKRKKEIAGDSKVVSPVYPLTRAVCLVVPYLSQTLIFSGLFIFLSM